MDFLLMRWLARMMVLIETAKPGDVVGSWAALFALSNADGQVTYRAFRGSALVPMAKAAKALVDEQGDGSVAAARLQVRMGQDQRFMAGPRAPRGDAAKLHTWALMSLRRDVAKLMAPARSGGLGFELADIEQSGLFGEPEPGTPYVVRPIAEQISAEARAAADTQLQRSAAVQRAIAMVSPVGAEAMAAGGVLSGRSARSPVYQEYVEADRARAASRAGRLAGLLGGE